MQEPLTRRELLKAGATAGATLAFGGCTLSNARRSQESADRGADLILTNGRIATLNQRNSSASALAIQNGRFVAVGDERSVASYRGSTTLVIDAGGRAVIPGLNDSHIHVIRGGLNYNMELRWDGVTSLGIVPA